MLNNIYNSKYIPHNYINNHQNKVVKYINNTLFVRLLFVALSFCLDLYESRNNITKLFFRIVLCITFIRSDNKYIFLIRIFIMLCFISDNFYHEYDNIKPFITAFSDSTNIWRKINNFAGLVMYINSTMYINIHILTCFICLKIYSNKNIDYLDKSLHTILYIAKISLLFFYARIFDYEINIFIKIIFGILIILLITSAINTYNNKLFLNMWILLLFMFILGSLYCLYNSPKNNINDIINIIYDILHNLIVICNIIFIYMHNNKRMLFINEKDKDEVLIQKTIIPNETDENNNNESINL